MHISLTVREHIHHYIDNTMKTGGGQKRKQTRATEICYNIRYFARHGRPVVRSSWSERQAGIFHSLNEDLMASQLVTIQLPEQVKDAVEDLLCRILEAADEDHPKLEHHLACHISIFTHLSSDWRPYLCFLESLLAEMVS